MASRRMSAEQALRMLLTSSEEETGFNSDSEPESEHGNDSGSEFVVSGPSDSESTSSADEAPEDRGVAMPQPRAPFVQAQAVRAGQSGPRRAARRVLPTFVDPSWVDSNMVHPVLPPFTGTPGCTVDTTNFQPIDFFQLFVDEEFLQEMVEQTNLYADAYLRDHSATLLPRARARLWSPTNVPELKQFWGLFILMGIVQKPAVSLYWSGVPVFLTPIFPVTMRRDRFLLLQRMLHFNDNTAALPREHQDFDRLFKVRPLLNHFANKFSTVYVPEKNISIDESLILFKGRLLFKQYIPSKRARYGIKLYLLSESNSGYAYSFRVYTGKDSEIDPAGCPQTLTTTGKIVWDLANSLFHMGYHLYVDNFYTSVALFKELYAVATVACGTIRSNRQGFPKQLVAKKLDRGMSSTLRCNELLALKFKDRRDVYVLSSIHDESTQPISVWGEGVVQKPTCIVDYNTYMGGVDKTDQLLEPYNAPHKTRRWYKKLAVHLMHLGMLNAFVVYSKTTPGKKMSFLDFEMKVVNSLIAVETFTPVATGQEDVDRLSQRHFIDIIPPTAKKDFPTKRCRVCWKQGIRREPRYYCPDCPSKPGLCLSTCYRLYHTKVKYWETS